MRFVVSSSNLRDAARRALDEGGTARPKQLSRGPGHLRVVRRVVAEGVGRGAGLDADVEERRGAVDGDLAALDAERVLVDGDNLRVLREREEPRR